MIIVNRNFRVTLAALTLLTLTGLGLQFFAQLEWLKGLGLALAFLCSLGLLVDSFAQRRAVPYTQALEALANLTPRAPKS